MKRAGRSMPTRVLLSALTFAIATVLLAGCEPVENARPATSGESPVSVPVALPEGPPIVVSDLPPEDRAPLTGPSRAPLPTEGDVLTAGQVLERLRARLSQPTCIVGPNNTRWRHKYAGYPQHFADEIIATLPRMLVVLDELETHKLPAEFAVIPIVESWYRPDVHSFGGASGMWQMLAETARNNGATVTSGYDGRLSTLDATDAAMNYLDKLQAMFNDWRLTAMAYNSGEYRLAKTMSPDELAARGAGGALHYRRPGGLAFTTYEYVSKMRALVCMLDQPQRQEIPFDTSVPITHWIRYTVPADVESLDELAQRLGTDAEELKSFNRGFHNGRIGDESPRTVLVPASTRSRWSTAVAHRLPEPPPPSVTFPTTTSMPSTTGAVKPAVAATPAPPPVPVPATGSFHAPAQAMPATSQVMVGQPPATAGETGSRPQPAKPAQTPAAAAQTTANGHAVEPASIETKPNQNVARQATATLPAATATAPAAMARPPEPQAATSQPVQALEPPKPAAVPPAGPALVGTPATGAAASTGSASSSAVHAVVAPASPVPAPEPHPQATAAGTSAAVTTPSTTHGAAVPTAPVAAAMEPAAAATAPHVPQPAAVAPPTTTPPNPVATAPVAAATTTAATGPASVDHAPVRSATVPSTSTMSAPVPVAAGTSAPAATATPPGPATTVHTYKVQLGDSLETIAARNKLKVEDLRAWNHLEGDATLYVDQVLKLEP